MKSMNLFGGNDKSSEALFGDSKPKEITNQLPSAPIQDKEGNLTFELERKTYSLNVYSEEERERVKEEVNSISLTQYDWFKEETGENHWVFYNTKMYEAERVNFLHYRSDCDLVPEIPINATSCYPQSHPALPHEKSQWHPGYRSTDNCLYLDSLIPLL